jgi:hypothetical protein
MVEEALLYHTVLSKIFLVLLAMNFFVPWFFRKEWRKEIRPTRITFFLFWAVLAMVAFSGMILWMLAKSPWSLEITAMTMSMGVLMIFEIARVKAINKAWMAEKSAFEISGKWVLSEIAVVIMVILMMSGGSVAIPVS